MSDDINMLHSLMKNAEMGKDSLNIIIPKIDDTNFELTLREQLKGYVQMYTFCEHSLDAIDPNHKDTNPIIKGLTRAGVELNTMNTNTPHLAEILIKGSNAGILDINKKMSEYPNLSSKTKELASNLLKYEENYVKDLQKFL